MVDNSTALLLIPLLPLAAGLLSRLLLSRKPQLACGLGAVSLLSSAGLAFSLLLQKQSESLARVEWQRPWLQLGVGLDVPLALSVGQGQLLFSLTVALLAVLVLLYSYAERSDDQRAGVFHAHITLFAGAMLLLLCADTLLLLYLAWELLGLFSYLLIAHGASTLSLRAARQAFWTTRATDMGLLLGLLILMNGFGWPLLTSIEISSLAALAAEQQLAALSLLSLTAVLVILAVIGKAAQWPLSFWLADAMAAPVPASALLHGATLVAAGPYLLVQLAELFQTLPLALGWLAVLGSLSCLLCGLMALFANDMKRLLAYSTASQLGLCVAGSGLLAEWPAFAHLLVHAWAKAGLFLAAGVLLTAWHARQRDSRDAAVPTLDQLRGALHGQRLLLGAVLMCCLPLLFGSGKDSILWAAWQRAEQLAPNGVISFAVMMPAAQWGWSVAAVLLTLGSIVSAAYLTRLIGILAARPVATSDSVSPRQQPRTAMQAVVFICATLGLLSLLLPLQSAGRGLLPPALAFKPNEWQWVPGSAELTGLSLALVPAMIGVALGLWLSRPMLAGAAMRKGLVRYFAHGMYLREAWHWLIVGGGMWLARLAEASDSRGVQRAADGLGLAGRGFARSSNWLDRHLIDGLRWQACELWWRIRRLHVRWLQTGDIQHYILIILLSAVVLCIVVVRPLSHIFAQMLARL
jgi:NADH-quinone oxidoreductase subunit L